jgi:hypothetical protein
MGEQKLSSDERKARRNLEKEFLPAFKQQAKSQGWGYLKPTAFQCVGEWFVSINPVVYTETRRTELQATVKPFAIDDLMSRICGFDGLEGTALSLRARGPHCLVLPMWTIDIDSDRDLAKMLDASAAFFSAVASKVNNLTLADFVSFVGEGAAPGQISYNHVAALILAQRDNEALVLCRRANEIKQWGGPAKVTEDGRMIGFFELASAWLQNNPQKAT